MARAGLSRLDIKRACDSLLTQGQYPSTDTIYIMLGSTGSKTTIHRYLKELEEEEGTVLKWTGTTSDAILSLVGKLAACLHKEGQAVVDQQVVAAMAQCQQVQAKADKLSVDPAAPRAELVQAYVTIANVQAAQDDMQTALQQCTIEAECSAQQLQNLTARSTEHKGLRRSLKDKLQHAHQALEYFRNANKEQQDQDVHRHKQQVQQLQAGIRQTNQTPIIKQGKIMRLNKDNTRLVTEAGIAAKHVRELEMRGEQAQLTFDQVRADQARMEAEHDVLRATVQVQIGELMVVRTEYENIVGELAKLSVLLEAQQVILTDYWAQLDVADPTA